MKKILVLLLLLGPMPAVAGPWPYPMHFVAPEPPQPHHRAEDLITRWGFPGENNYNRLILEAVEQNWGGEQPLPPLLFKALIATESAFRPSAVSRTGAAGLVQLTPDTARRFGLRDHERLNPELALPIGVAVLLEKHAVVGRPAEYYQLVLGKPQSTDWGDRVALAYEELGRPLGEDRWRLDLAAFNGGGATVLRAMARAREQGLDPRKWENLIEPVHQPSRSPLYYACRQIYGYGAANKYREMREYPEKILRYYREAGGRSTF
ncbi:MAG: transglycosylase SLT domain-containing protein [Armatimonadetes bacterium]|nr:transglycosylase SLT domain-containing protein [Armatimonadota bacterium]